ncbi:hypothetical protein L1987_18089 [Smallanthus sonchifolius]|uniref:Uncharacterized protein n=1 Tax=Smallanthus sonchifolius TaxID=185202 RepID=A0ACB9IZ44_9ASTR|nr:hypothetical protein L1987_18089 [Smallanthus sonchifolius]
MEDECTTPRQLESRIPPPTLCPPAPRKKSTAAAKKREPPKSGYFRPPELDAFFAIDAPSKLACIPFPILFIGFPLLVVDLMGGLAC